MGIVLNIVYNDFFNYINDEPELYIEFLKKFSISDSRVVFKIETTIACCIGIAIGTIFILAGIFNWKGILLFNTHAEVLIEMLRMKGYRILYIILGILIMVSIILTLLTI